MKGDDHPNDDAPHIGNVIGFQDRPGVFCTPWLSGQAMAHHTTRRTCLRRRGAYLPLNTALRFCRKAETPSL